MPQFLLGFAIGFILMGLSTLKFPMLLTGVQQELVKQDHGTYHPTTKEFTLKECK